MWLLLTQHVMLPHPNLTPISSRATRPHPSNKPICHLCERTGDCTGSGIDCWHRAKTIKFIKWSVSVLLSLFCPCLTSTPSFSFPLPPRSFLFQLNQIFLYKCSVSSSEQPGFARRSPPLRFSSLIPWHLFKLRPRHGHWGFPRIQHLSITSRRWSRVMSTQKSIYSITHSVTFPHVYKIK